MIIGIDVAKDKLDICILPQNECYQVKNNRTNIAALFKKLQNKNEDIELVLFEATGGYEKPLFQYLIHQKLPLHRVHPIRAKRFAQSKGIFAKTDKIDALVLAKYGQQSEIQADDYLSENQLQIQELSARKTQIKEIIIAEKVRLSMPYLNKYIARSIKRVIKQLDAELTILTRALDKLISTDQQLQHKRELLSTVKGIGAEISSTLVADLPELGRLGRGEISSLAGLAPECKQSGKTEGYRRITRGRATVRKALYMGALVAIRHNPRMNEIYTRLIGNGKKKKVALVAVMRKMLIMMNAMVKNDKAWQSERI